MNAASGTLHEVVGHWLPRMYVAGLPPVDLTRLIEEAGDWSNWCRTFSDEAERHLEMGQEAERNGRLLTAGEAYLRAALFFHFGQFMFFDDFNQKARATEAKITAYARAAPLLRPAARALKIPFEDGDLSAFLRLPEKTPAPLVILVPGSDSTKEEFPALEENFLRRGLATLSLDGPGQGEGRRFGELRADFGPALAAAMAILPEIEGIVVERVGLMGMAFGGHLVLRAASSLPEVKALICMNGFFDLGGFWDELPPVYRRNMRFALGGEDEFTTADRARAFNLRDMPRLSCPTLIIHGGQDRIFPSREVEAMTGVSAVSEAVVYPHGNHVCNNIAYRYRPQMADWLVDRLHG